MSATPDKPEEGSEKLKATADFAGPVEKRSCTDVLFLLLIIAAWVAMTGVGIDSIEQGDPRILVNGIDYAGNICGYTSSVKDLKYLFWINEYTTVCIDECPSVDGGVNFNKKITKYYTSDSNCTINIDCQYEYDTKNIIGHCIPKALMNATDKGQNYFTQFMSDVLIARNYVFGFSLGVSSGFAFIYTFVLRIPGFVTLMVWGSILLISIFLFATGFVGYKAAKDWQEEDPRTHENYEINGMRTIAWGAVAVGVVWTLVVIFLRKRINLAIAVIKESARAIQAMPTLLVLPVIQVLGLSAFLLPWAYYCIYLASLGNITLESHEFQGHTITVRSFQYDSQLKKRGWFMLFMLYWTAEFIIAEGELIIAIAVATWFFTRNKSETGSGTVSKAIRQGLWYHAGTAAFGSIIIAIIKTIRTFIAQLQKQAKKSGNKIAQVLLCCVQCCMWCFEKCMKFVNRNAYIQTAIFSYSFCTACKKAFFLILRNIARITAVSIVSGMVLFIGQLFVMGLTSTLAFYALTYFFADNINSVTGLVVLIAFISWFVASMFTSIFGMAISTIIQCFIADEEMFADNPSARFAEKDLKDFIDTSESSEKSVEIKNKV